MNPHKNEKQFNFDLLLNGINFSGALLALASLKSGLKVAIKTPSGFDNTFQPELSNFYPMAVVDSIQSLRNFNFLMKCSALFPNHFFPQRVLSFNSQGTYRSSLNNAIDTILKRDRENASLPVKTEKFKTYQSLSKKYPVGSLVYEYRFDRNRAIIDLLKLCIENGAAMLNHNSEFDYGIELTCNEFDRNGFSIDIDDFKWPYPNSFNIKKEHFSITFQGNKDKTIIQFYLFSSELNVDEFVKDVFEIFKNLSLPVSIDLTLQLRNIFIKNEYQNKIDFEIIKDPKLFELRNYTLSLLKNVSSILGKKIDLNNTWQAFHGNEIRSENFRLLQNECDEKFDLAKQTGINYDHFILLFYRYQNYIDLMIEAAYEMMNKVRDPEIIWNKVEQEFLKEEQLYFQ